MIFWALLATAGAVQMRGDRRPDVRVATRLRGLAVQRLAPRIQEKFGGVEPLIVVAQGRTRDAMKDPQVLKTMESSALPERDRDIGYSVSLTDILRSVNMVFHELEPKWGVIPSNARDVAQTFFIFFSGSPPTETAKYVTADYQTAHVTFFARNHKGENIARIIERCKEFIAANPMEKAEFKLAGGLIGVLAAANQELVRNDLLMNILGFGTIYVIVLFTYRSWAAGVYLSKTTDALPHEMTALNELLRSQSETRRREVQQQQANGNGRGSPSSSVRTPG
jgi:predicted RND superfamily exporter protein